MSSTAYWLTDRLDKRSQFARPGVRAAEKKRLARAARRKAVAGLTTEVVNLDRGADLAGLTPAELDDYVDALLASSSVADDARVDLEDGYLVLDDGSLMAGDAESSGIPAELQGALPDWVLDQLEVSNGNAFDALSLFETKTPSSREAAFYASNQDEMFYA